MTPFRQFVNNSGDLLSSGLGIVGQALQIEKAATFDRIEADLALETMRFRESLKADENYDNFITEDGAGGKFGRFRGDMEAKIRKATDGKLYQDQAISYLQKTMVGEEQYTRQFQAQQMMQVGLKNSLQSTAQILTTVKDDPLQLKAEMDTRYADTRARFVDSGVMLKDTFDGIWKETMTPFVDNVVGSQVDKALAMGGMDAVESYASWLQNNPTAITGEDGPAITFDKDTIVALGQKKAEEQRKVRAEEYDKGMADILLIGKDIPGAKKLLAEARSTMDQPQYRYWASNLDAIERKEEGDPDDLQKRTDKNWESAYFSAYTAGATRAERERLLVLGDSMGVTTTILEKYRKENNSPEWQDDALDGLIGEIKKDKKLSDADKGMYEFELRQYAQSSRNLQDPKKYGVRYDELKSENFRKKLSAQLTTIARGGFPDVILDPSEGYQKRIQDGDFSGLVITSTKETIGKDGKKIIDTIIDSPNKESLELLHKNQAQLFLQDFGEVKKPEHRIANDGQLSFILDGKEYAYMIPKGRFDEALMVKTKDGWEEAKAPEKAKSDQAKASQNAAVAAKEKAKREELNNTAKNYGAAAPIPPSYKWGQDKKGQMQWLQEPPEERKRIIESAPADWRAANGY